MKPFLLACLLFLSILVQGEWIHPNKIRDERRARSFAKYQELFTVGGLNNKHFCKPKDIRLVLLGQSWIHFNSSTLNLNWTEGVYSVAELQQTLNALSPTVLFSNLETALNGTFAVANNAVIVNFGAPHVSDPTVSDVLQNNYSVNIVTVSNNHFADLGPLGTISGLQELTNRHLKYTGAGINDLTAVIPTYLQHNTNHKQVGVMGLVGATQTQNAVGWIANATFPGVNGLPMINANTPDPNKVQFELNATTNLCQTADIAMFYHHNHWYTSNTTVDPWLQTFAHQVIDAGATLYLGQGTESIRGAEIYKGNLVLYGNGNFVFNGQVSDPNNFREALIFDVCYDGKSTELLAARAIPLWMSQGEGQPWSQEWNETHGLPMLSHGAQANSTLQSFKALSAALGTTVVVDDVNMVADIVLQPLVLPDPSLNCLRNKWIEREHDDEDHNDNHGKGKGKGNNNTSAFRGKKGKGH